LHAKVTIPVESEHVGWILGKGYQTITDCYGFFSYRAVTQMFSDGENMTGRSTCCHTIVK